MEALGSVVIALAAMGGTPDGVLLDFSADWCGPCQSMMPVVHRLQKQGYAIRTVDIDQEPELARRFRIRTIPTFVLVVRGQEKQRFTGSLSEAQLRRMASMIPVKPEEPPAKRTRERPRRKTPPTAASPSGHGPRPEASSRSGQAPSGQSRSGQPRASEQDASTRTTDNSLAANSGPGTSRAGNSSRVSQPSNASPDGSSVPGSSARESSAPAEASAPATSGPPRPDVIRANISDEAPAKYTRDPMQVCTRIRVKDRDGMDIGSGTIIHSEPGRTVILTCGHIFRHFKEGGRIEVDVFQGDRPRLHDGKLIKYDLEADVGLISISTLEALSAARVAGTALEQGQLVFSVGCGGGEPPSKLQHRVTSTTKFPAGYVECTGTPIQGRSGGGLFTARGEVSGVCVLADPSARRGLYTGLKSVHRLLDECGLRSLYRNAASQKEPLFVAEGRDRSRQPRSRQPRPGNPRPGNPRPGNRTGNPRPGNPRTGREPAAPKSKPVKATNPETLPPFEEPDFSVAQQSGNSAADQPGFHAAAGETLAADRSASERTRPSAPSADRQTEIASESLPGSPSEGIEPPSALAGLQALAQAGNSPDARTRVRSQSPEERSGPEGHAGPESRAGARGSAGPAGSGPRSDSPQAPAREKLFVSPSASSLSDTLEAARGAEVVCVIRDRDRPDAPSRVVVIHKASNHFVSDLTSEVENQVQPTSLTLRRVNEAQADRAVQKTRPTRRAAGPPEIKRYRRRR